MLGLGRDADEAAAQACMAFFQEVSMADPAFDLDFQPAYGEA
ncbi:MAG TPA: MBL fold metallo-hydrolase, partial [Agrobacterium sp.]|nr:MBL fold metallo-hydrolase [Agrobacterium sp.]